MQTLTDKRGAYSSVALTPHEANKQIQGRIRQITVAFLMMVLPMLLLSALLLGLIFRYRVPPNQFVSDNLGMKQDYSGAYLVRISATTLVTVASWSSTLSPVLIGFAVTLASYPAAKHLLAASTQGDTAQLPTPFQFSLIISIISSSAFSSLWNWMTYTFGWSNKRQGQVKALKGLTSVLIMGLILSALVLAADTWLHFSTKSIIFTQVRPNPDISNLGFGITPNCTEDNRNNKHVSCNIIDLFDGYVDYGNEALKIFANVSEIMSASVHTVGQDNYVYIANPQTARVSTLDYTVGTYAVKSQCKPVTSQCTNRSMQSGHYVNYTCPFDFAGTLYTREKTGNADVKMAFFTNSSGSEAPQPGLRALDNPYHYAAMLLTGIEMEGSDALAKDPDVLGNLYESGTFAVVFCNSTAYDVTYSSVNGTIVDWTAMPSNSSTMRLVQAGTQYIRLGMPYLLQAVSVAGFSDSGQDIADQFALAYSRVAVATTAMIFEPRDALTSQTREQIQVAKVPKAPLYVLLAANLLMVVFGLMLTALAYLTSSGDTGEVQARLSIHALVAAAFEPRVETPVKDVEFFFEEKHGEQGSRLGFTRTPERGWTLERHVLR